MLGFVWNPLDLGTVLAHGTLPLLRTSHWESGPVPRYGRLTATGGRTTRCHADGSSPRDRLLLATARQPPPGSGECAVAKLEARKVTHRACCSTNCVSRTVQVVYTILTCDY